MRDRKPIVVDRISVDGAHVDVSYDFRNRNFFFELPGSRAREGADTFKEVLRRLYEVYEAAEPLAWRPVILVTLHEKYDDRDHSIRTTPIEGASVHLEFRRCELSPGSMRADVVARVTADRETNERLGRRGREERGPIEREGFLEREHAIDFEAGEPSDHEREVRAKTLDRPSNYSNRPDVVELPYSEETWRGLHALKRAIDKLHGRVLSLIGRVDFQDRLARFAATAEPGRLLSQGDAREGP